MKANRALKLKQDDDAVSAVIGAVLVLAVLTVALVQWRTEWVPVLESENEATSALLVDSQMGAIRAHLNRVASNATDDASALPVKLGAQEGKALGDSISLPNGILTDPAGALWNVSAADMQVFRSAGRSLVVAGNNWTDIPSTVQIEEIRSIQQLRWRIADVDAAHDTRLARATILDKESDFAGSYEVRVDIQTPMMLVHHEVRNADNDLVTSRVDSYGEAAVFSPYFVDLLNPEVAFDQIISAAKGPLTLTMIQDPGFDTAYMAEYRLEGTSGRTPYATSGKLETDYQATLGSGHIKFTANNAYYPSQQVIVENGAVIIVQDDGAVFRSEPLVSMLSSTSRVFIDVTAPKLVGEANSVNGDLVANIIGIPLGQNTVVGATSKLNFTITTEHPGIWSSFFFQRLQAAGLSDTGLNPGFNITETANGILVDIFGPRSDPASTSRDVVLRFKTATILMDIDT